MAKIPFNDVVPPNKRSIRDVPIPNSGKRKTPIIINSAPKAPPKTEPEIQDAKISTNQTQPEIQSKISSLQGVKVSGPYEYYYPKEKQVSAEKTIDYKSGNKKKFIFSGLSLVVVLVFVVSMMTVFASATIVVVPKSQELDVSMEIKGTKEASPESVHYEIIKLSESKTASVPATGEETVELKARGKIIVYNSYSSEPQRLIIRTRFESPEGLIFRIPESITVPGKTIKNGVETPGSIEVEVFADEAGEKYNIKKTDFTVPGFKNDPARYRAFYARSVSDMEGGFVGKRKTVSQADKDLALKNIGAELEVNLEKGLKSKIPDGLSVLSGGIIYEFSELPQDENSSSVIIGREATGYAIMLDRQDLSEEIIYQYISAFPDWQDIKGSIIDFSSLSITEKPDQFKTEDNLTFKIEGRVKVFAELNPDLISQRLAGIDRKRALDLMDEYVGISSMTASIKPMWKKAFPENPLKIKVQINTNQ